MSASLAWSTAEALGWEEGSHAHSLVAVVMQLSEGCRRTSVQQLLLGLLQLSGFFMVHVEESYGSLGINLGTVGLRNVTW